MPATLFSYPKNDSHADFALEFQHIANSIILPVEMILGFLLQIVNLAVLHTSRIKGLVYTIYLKALAVTYLLTMVFMLPNIIRKNKVEDTGSFFAMFYHAHCEQYFINLLLFSGNLIIVALAVEPLRAILFPFEHNFSSASASRRSCIVLGWIYASVAIILLPITLSVSVVPSLAETNATQHAPMNHVALVNTSQSPNSRDQTEPDNLLTAENDSISQVEAYQLLPTSNAPWIDSLRYVLTAVFEISLILLVFAVYACLLIKFKIIARRHRRSVMARAQTSAATLNASQEKATVMCLASVTAFLFCNALSASKETLYFAYYFKGELTLSAFAQSSAKIILNTTANILLVFNFSLNFLLQSAFSFQYRAQLKRFFCRCFSQRRRSADENHQPSSLIKLRSLNSSTFNSSTGSKQGQVRQSDIHAS